RRVRAEGEAYVNRHSIRHRLLFLLFIPIASLLFFGVQLVRQRQRDADASAHMSQVAEIGVRAGAFLHHSQRERGLSAAALGARGDESFRAKLTEQRKLTDEAIVAFRAAVDGMGRA